MIRLLISNFFPFQRLRPKARNQIGDQTFDRSVHDDMLNDIDMITAPTANDKHFIDGQLANNIKSKTNADFEMVLFKEPKINGGNGTMPLSNNINSFNAQQPPPAANSGNELEKLESMAKESSSNDAKENKLNETAKNFNENMLSIDGGPLMSSMNKSLDSNSVSEAKVDVATADVIIVEYPSECFPEPMYQYCPWCLSETPFWAKWKKIRSKCYKFVEHKYFETLVITLILISSMALVKANLIIVHYCQ